VNRSYLSPKRRNTKTGYNVFIVYDRLAQFLARELILTLIGPRTS
jgi:hypothetical protein